jgi:hypothetical protein
MKVTSPVLKAALAAFRAEERAAMSATGTLNRIIDDYCRSRDFSEYTAKHTGTIAKYLAGGQQKRATRWRASAAGRCPQQQSYERLLDETAGRDLTTPTPEYDWVATEPPMKPTARRALSNGTYAHARWHMTFDALHERGDVQTLAAEEIRFNMDYSVSGTIDRLVTFDVNNAPFTILLDFKTIHNAAFKDLIGPEITHVKQMATYFFLEFPCDWGMLLYENKNTQAIKLIDVDKSNRQIKSLKDLWRLMGQWVDQMHQGVKLSQRVKLPIIQDWCTTCPYDKMCRVEHPNRDSQLLEGLPSDDTF